MNTPIDRVIFDADKNFIEETRAISQMMLIDNNPDYKGWSEKLTRLLGIIDKQSTHVEQQQWINVEEYEKLVEAHAGQTWCWIKMKANGSVDICTHVCKEFTYLCDHSLTYDRENIEAVMPILKPQPPKDNKPC